LYRTTVRTASNASDPVIHRAADDRNIFARPPSAFLF
jgi:hypothetical protein